MNSRIVNDYFNNNMQSSLVELEKLRKGTQMCRQHKYAFLKTLINYQCQRYEFVLYKVLFYGVYNN